MQTLVTHSHSDTFLRQFCIFSQLSQSVHNSIVVVACYPPQITHFGKIIKAVRSLTIGLTFCASLHLQGLFSCQDGVLAGELSIHQGGVRHEAVQDVRVDGQRGQGHWEDHGRQGLHLRRVQEREGHISRESNVISQNKPLLRYILVPLQRSREG